MVKKIIIPEFNKSERELYCFKQVNSNERREKTDHS